MKRIILSLAVIAIAGTIVVGATRAYFTSTQTSTGNIFTAGTLSIDLGNGNEGQNFNLGTISNMAPGDITNPVEIRVNAKGSIDEATFGRFTLGEGDNKLAEVLKIYDYKVQYYKSNGTASDRWNRGGVTGGHDPYYGTAVNEDYFIKDGDAGGKWAGVGGSTNLLNWASPTGSGPQDGVANWDIEGLKSGAYYVITVRFQMDPAANDDYQGTSATIGFEAKATQLNTTAITDLLAPTPWYDSSTTYLKSELVDYNL